MGKRRINWRSIEDKAEDLVRQAATQALPGEAKMEWAVDRLVEHIDEVHAPKSPIAEVAADLGLALLKFVLRGLIQSHYERLKGTITAGG